MVDRSGPSIRVRTAFISDIHLGFRGCSAELLQEFLHRVDMDTLFLVGDIIDVWSMQKSMFWPQSHNNVLRTILGKAKRGTKVIFVPGNHDEVFRDFDGAAFGNLEIHILYRFKSPIALIDVLHFNGRWRHGDAAVVWRFPVDARAHCFTSLDLGM